MSLQIYVQLKTREINNKDIIMKKLLKLLQENKKLKEQFLK